MNKQNLTLSPLKSHHLRGRSFAHYLAIYLNPQNIKRAIILLTFFLPFFISFCQSNDLLTRRAFTLKLPIDKIHFYQAEISPSNFILPNNTIQIYPGEKLYIEINVKRNKIVDMKSVREIKDSTKTIVISLAHVENDSIYSRTVLDVQNPFKKDLIYIARMYLMKYNKWVPTDVYPVRSKLHSIEMWPEVIVTMALTGWEFK